MLIKVQYTTQLKAAIGQAEEAVEIADGSTVVDLIQFLAAHHSDAFRRLVLDSSGHLLPSILLCIDDQQIDAGDSKRLSDGSVVTFLSAISGG